jgi:hypothetical protein
MAEMNMLDHQKLILQNVTGDNSLFRKELQKSLSWLEEDDRVELYNWLKENYWESHGADIQKIYNLIIV